MPVEETDLDPVPSESTSYGTSPDLSEPPSGPYRTLVCVAPGNVLHHMLSACWENNISLRGLMSGGASLIVQPFE